MIEQFTVFHGGIMGNDAGCIWIQDCSNVVIRDVIARNYNSDGISWQVCHDVLVENCHNSDNPDSACIPVSVPNAPLCETITSNGTISASSFAGVHNMGLRKKTSSATTRTVSVIMKSPAVEVSEFCFDQNEAGALLLQAIALKTTVL